MQLVFAVSVVQLHSGLSGSVVQAVASARSIKADRQSFGGTVGHMWTVCLSIEGHYQFSSDTVGMYPAPMGRLLSHTQ